MMDYHIGTTCGRSIAVSDASTPLILDTLAAVQRGLDLVGITPAAAEDRLRLEIFIRERNLRNAT